MDCGASHIHLALPASPCRPILASLQNTPPPPPAPYTTAQVFQRCHLHVRLGHLNSEGT